MLSFLQNLKDFLKGFSLCRIFVHVHTCTRHKHKRPRPYLKARSWVIMHDSSRQAIRAKRRVFGKAMFEMTGIGG